MITVEDMFARAERAEEDPEQKGCFDLTPPVEVLHMGQIIHVNKVDIRGHWPGTVRAVEYEFWSRLSKPEFPK